MSDLSSLCHRVTLGDVEALGPLLDLLEERQDWRLRELHSGTGLLITATDTPRDLRNARKEFLAEFKRLFWEELGGGRSAALSSLEKRLVLADLQWNTSTVFSTVPWDTPAPSTPLADLQAMVGQIRAGGAYAVPPGVIIGPPADLQAMHGNHTLPAGTLINLVSGRNEAIIAYFGQQARVACDRNCGKAWGSNSRPRIQLSDNEDDYAYMADGELGEAPADPGTTEGEDRKPTSPDQFPNKWCCRECERAVVSQPGEYMRPLTLPDFSRRVYNIPLLHLEEATTP